jgi:uncharacterized YigZ family protein
MSGGWRYYSVKEPVRAQFTVSGSRFIATLAPAATEEEAYGRIDTVKEEFADATHNTFAFRIGAGSVLLERAFDDREPAGTAGPPMLQALQGAKLSDTVVVGTRYFGGIKLGIGGLARAYRNCVRESLFLAELVEREQRARFRIGTSYRDLGAVTRHIESLGGEIICVDYTGDVTITAAVPERAVQALSRGLGERMRGRGRLERLK